MNTLVYLTIKKESDLWKEQLHFLFHLTNNISCKIIFEHNLTFLSNHWEILKDVKVKFEILIDILGSSTKGVILFIMIEGVHCS